MDKEKVLMVSWAWYPSGGDWTYVQNVQRLYESQGYEVIPFSTNNFRNVPVNGPAYFIDAPDYKELNKNKSLPNVIKAVKNSIVSKNALDAIDQILTEHRIRIAHLHNIHHYITPAIVHRLKKAGVKILWSLHDYQIICPVNTFISHGKICERCITGKYYNCAIHTCKRDSFGASTLASIEAYYYRNKGTYNLVDAFLCPSSFLKSKFLQAGFSENKLFVSNLCYDVPVIDNFIRENKLKNVTLSSSTRENNYILYVGRLEDVKGIRTLIHAVEGTPITLKIAGTGDAASELEALVKGKNLSNIEFLGFQDKASVFELTLHAKFVVVPSEWYENFPFSVIESFLFSKPVVGSKIGGIPELVKHEQTGLLFEAGNISELRQNLLRLWIDHEAVIQWGKNARELVYRMVNFETHWQKLQSIINSIN
ncbi:MAG: glycosyltransferase family 4 protein [Ferruginibacter sp.]|nr:glycosyltransferase family 4 protein [Ferruginibacter sp.]